ncbi:MAG: hypothetical protein NTV62_02240 [Candidatus Gribaldobacteria bacterium]|nr:hypothetical protein [Candidatus Gribaldobacteria bacterium]
MMIWIIILSLPKLMFVGLAVFFLCFDPPLFWGAIIVMIIYGVYDILDGNIPFTKESSVRKISDNALDKISIGAILTATAIKMELPTWFWVPFSVKYFLTLVGGILLLSKRKELWPSSFNKITFAAPVAAFVVLRSSLAVYCWVIALVLEYLSLIDLAGVFLKIWNLGSGRYKPKSFEGLWFIISFLRPCWKWLWK